jgi:hypothetical protein|tara:strand:+ start:453 stop:635 length:183 start_codon:yes stop_codon:yes gene_type:complete
MAKDDIKKMINSIEAGDNVEASNAFSASMVDKQRDAIDTKRLDVQLDWLNKQEQPANEEV